SDQNSVDLSRNKAGEEPGASLAKTSQNLCKGPFEILNSVRPRIDGLHCIDQNNLAIQLGDVFAKERPDDMGLVGFVSTLHHGAQGTWLAFRIRQVGQR